MIQLTPAARPHRNAIVQSRFQSSTQPVDLSQALQEFLTKLPLADAFMKGFTAEKKIETIGGIHFRFELNSPNHLKITSIAQLNTPDVSIRRDSNGYYMMGVTGHSDFEKLFKEKGAENLYKAMKLGHIIPLTNKV